jgi:branched-subunit amino acid transport protein
VEAPVSEAWITIVVLAVATALIKGAGPAAVGGRELPRPAMRVIALLAPALLAALIMVETFGGEGRSLTLDARAAGLVVAAAVLATTESLIGAVISAAGATALLRLIG